MKQIQNYFEIDSEKLWFFENISFLKKDEVKQSTVKWGTDLLLIKQFLPSFRMRRNIIFLLVIEETTNSTMNSIIIFFFFISKNETNNKSSNKLCKLLFSLIWHKQGRHSWIKRKNVMNVSEMIKTTE